VEATRSATAEYYGQAAQHLDLPISILAALLPCDTSATFPEGRRMDADEKTLLILESPDWLIEPGEKFA